MIYNCRNNCFGAQSPQEMHSKYARKKKVVISRIKISSNRKSNAILSPPEHKLEDRIMRGPQKGLLKTPPMVVNIYFPRKASSKGLPPKDPETAVTSVFFPVKGLSEISGRYHRLKDNR